MKRLIVMLMLMFSAAAYAKQYSSAFGFTIQLPADWFVFSQQEVKENRDLFNFDDPQFAGTDKQVLESIKSKVETGAIEIYFHKGVGNAAFGNNINVLKQIEQVPSTGDDVKKACDQLPGMLSQAFGKQVHVYQCASKVIAGKKAILGEFDGVGTGVRCIQYQIQKSDNIALIVTGTFTESTLERERAGFAAIVQSISFN